MAQQQARAGALGKVDPVWARIRREAEEIARNEPELATFTTTWKRPSFIALPTVSTVRKYRLN